MDLLKKLSAQKVLPATVVPRTEHAVPMARALLAGGLSVMEVTLRNAEAPESIRRICDEVMEVCCGAGTILTLKDLDAAMDAGAQFGLSPGFNPTIVREAVARDFPFIPGVQTAGEMEQSMELGCPIVKFFPAEAAGGIDFIKAVSAPYGHTPLRIIPLGGISAQNMRAYLELPLVPAVGGSWIANKALLEKGDFAQVELLAREAVSIAQA